MNLLSVATVARRLDTATTSVYRLLASGELTPIRIGSQSIRIAESDLDDYIRRTNQSLEFQEDDNVKRRSK
jgi:excisionase family DNA binding protein